MKTSGIFYIVLPYVYLEVRNMLGRVVLLPTPGKARTEPEVIAGLPMLRADLCLPKNISERRLRRQLGQLRKAMLRQGIRRVVFPDDFPHINILLKILPDFIPVEPLPLYRAAAHLLLLADLRRKGIPPVRAAVRLSAPALCPELTAAAERLCPEVRRLIIDAPGGGEFAARLYRSCGMPVTPDGPADACAAFGPVEAESPGVLRLYGTAPELRGLTLAAPSLALPTDCAQSLLAALWECGRVNFEQLTAVPCLDSDIQPDPAREDVSGPSAAYRLQH